MSQNGEIFRTLDCMSLALLLALNWDEQRFRRVIKRAGHQSDGTASNPALLFHRLHRECRNASGAAADALARHFHRLHAGEQEALRRRPVNIDSDELLQYTTARFTQNPGGIFWAMATDERPEISSLLTYHVHLLTLGSFHPERGALVRCARQEQLLAEQEIETGRLRQNQNELRIRLTALERENHALKRSLAETRIHQRELRMLRYELGKVSRNLPSQSERVELGESFCLRPSSPAAGEGKNPLSELPSALPLPQSELSLTNARILLVGGLERLREQYRHTFESLGTAEFFFHSGRCDGGGAEQLRFTTKSADIVVFITRVNSHNALNVLRRVCRKNAKRLLTVRETGPEQISRLVLDEWQRLLAAGRG